MAPGIGIFLIIAGIVVGVIVLVAVATPVVVLAWRLVRHVARFIGAEAVDILRAVGALITSVFFLPMIVGSVLIGRWSAASHFGRAWQSEMSTLLLCGYRVALSHPLRLLGLHSLVAGLEERLPQAVADAPGADRPSARTGQFDGYRIVGSLPGGGSGSKLYIAEPDAIKRAALERGGQAGVEQVVIKSFSLHDGSSLPQIIRESRSLEAAKRMGLVLDHAQTNERFYYVMRYVPGAGLGAVIQQLHAESAPSTPPGLDDRRLKIALGYVADLLRTLEAYHAGGLWHKDVKPDNIIVDGRSAHLVDFGLLTHLRSAMTLTTHGTEYFRDPEMVRLALRGVKVHEVDGVKFDLYAAGAVLYSALENSFPAHGALSQLTKRCPEAVKWIIRRAMAEYDQRYTSAGAMLADVAVVLAADDPMAVKPVALPSMGGAAAAGEFAAATVPPPFPGAAAGPGPAPGPFMPAGQGAGATPPPFPGSVGGKTGWAALAASAAKLAQDAAHMAESAVRQSVGQMGNQGGAQAGGANGGGKPKIAVRNWWTGDFSIEHAHAAGSPVPPAAFPDAARAHAAVRPAAFRPVAIPVTPMAARPSAEDQLKSARARIDARRTRALDRLNGRRSRPTRPAPAGINVGVIFAVLLTFALIGAGLLLTFTASRQVAVASTAPAVRADGQLAVITPPAWVELPQRIAVLNPNQELIERAAERAQDAMAAQRLWYWPTNPATMEWQSQLVSAEEGRASLDDETLGALLGLKPLEHAPPLGGVNALDAARADALSKAVRAQGREQIDLAEQHAALAEEQARLHEKARQEYAQAAVEGAGAAARVMVVNALPAPLGKRDQEFVDALRDQLNNETAEVLGDLSPEAEDPADPAAERHQRYSAELRLAVAGVEVGAADFRSRGLSWLQRNVGLADVIAWIDVRRNPDGTAAGLQVLLLALDQNRARRDAVQRLVVESLESVSAEGR